MKKAKLLSTISLAGIFLLLCTLVSCEYETTSKKADEQLQTLLDKGLIIWNTGDMAIVEEVYSPDLVYHQVGIDEDFTGLDAFKEYVTRIRSSWSDFNVVYDTIVYTRGWTIAQWTLSGTNTGPFNEQPPTGKPMTLSGTSIYHIKDGKVIEEWIYYNQSAVLGQLGYTFTPPMMEEVE